ncbi:MAG: radical SAM protein [Candidatus Tectomicrobia bacterium]|uniref:Radical SAM protein n=1 Tax=Tectimicrobiota bacterium TaxID=2528274 RepID=A0A932FZ89_UNCTE|nr:radical SAM protein [Candidatus Tectomicrobia bacterium]
MDLQQYVQNRGFVGVISKKGCPQGCIWCPSPYYPGRKVTVRDPIQVVNEIEWIQKEQGVSAFYFCDDIFNNPSEHAQAVCDEIISRKLEIVWGCDLNPATINRDLVSSMKRSGCVAAGPHFISASAKVLRQMTTGFTLEDIRRCCQLLEDAEVSYSAFVILGGPGEDRETVEESIRFCQEVHPAAIFYFTGVRILPNTGMEAYARQRGIVSSDEELLFPKFYLSPEVEGWLEERLVRLSESDPHWVKLKVE